MANVTNIKQKQNKQSIYVDRFHTVTRHALDNGLSAEFIAGLLIGEAMTMLGQKLDDPQQAIVNHLQAEINARNKKVVNPLMPFEVV